jgi:hypothetical protein
LTRWTEDQLESYNASRKGKKAPAPVKKAKYLNKKCVYFKLTGVIVPLERLTTPENRKKYIKDIKELDEVILFDSLKEARRYTELLFMEKAGKINNLSRQPKFNLLEKYTNNQGEKVRETNYIGDFLYQEKGILICEDTKGFRTKEFLLKKKLFENKYKNIYLRVI